MDAFRIAARTSFALWGGRFNPLVVVDQEEWLLGCRRDEIRVYRVPKEPKPVQLAMANPHQNSPGFIKWTLPAGWKEELPDSIKAASFSVLSADGRMAHEESANPFICYEFAAKTAGLTRI